MIQILHALEPRTEKKDTILINELDEQNEVLFFNHGTIEIGYEINRIKKYVLRFKGINVIGAYDCTFNKRSTFVYKTISVCKGYSIRKHKWKAICQSNQELSSYLNVLIFHDFETRIKKKILIEKEQDMIKWSQRADYESILAI